MRVASRLLCAAALLLAFLTSWIFLPAPNLVLLALGIGAPELSQWLIVCGLVVAILTIGAAGRGPWGRAAFILAVVATLAASAPLAQVPFVIRRFDATMRAALGTSGVTCARRRAGHYHAACSPICFAASTRRRARDQRRLSAPWIRLTLDVYQPSAAGPHPSVVQIYGGAWQRGEPADNATFATYLAAHGYVVFAIDYRHAPEFPWPAQIDDVRAALAWIRGHAGDYDADASRLALLGRSAGAHLAMMAAYEAGAPPVRAVVSYYGPVDLTDGYLNPPSPDPLDVRAIEEALLGGTPDQMPDRYREASPISYVTRRLPPSLLVYGGRDHVVLPTFGARLDERLRAQGATSVYLEIPWAEHAFDAVPNGPSGQLSLYYTEQFLAWALRPL
jgi:acetyl esterase/lipase